MATAADAVTLAQQLLDAVQTLAGIPLTSAQISQMQQELATLKADIAAIQTAVTKATTDAA